ncbi:MULTISPECIES: GNAT family N-acetyltransferase [unclassified Gordonia (in: high G+C Gram-positive bacteria)]|jgi:predicted GNAT family acetyltransferase|uniref:GNAT family N-acetyltransferase n=1 Tax=unclassified Gordonia (in: high G+C Gram-positive bacteria) TaxID=2657482 RepID=UPI0019658295|nr:MULTISPECIES: GNAT family N-acetyltransferase [unclassified Gordonia (in: high G+C Gram-positive bacteria)]MBN0973722.1 N-acetyltransferase [Gordonia sp. BP-119]MBN0983604.1 N-acetyltransferase [Gordonia sp. BP-94]
MTSDKTGAQTAVSDNPAERRYEITVEGTTAPAGFAEYRDRDAGSDPASGVARVFFHTEVDPAFGGRGLATILVREALDDARDRGLRIVGVCPLVAAFLKKNPEYASFAEPVTPAALTWLRAQKR